MPYKDWSLIYKFLFNFLLMVTLPTLFIGMFIYLEMNQVYEEQAIIDTKGTLDKIERNLTSIIEDTENVSLYSIYNADFRSFMMEEKDLQEISRSRTNIEGYLIFQLMSKDYINSIQLMGNNGEELYMGEGVEGDESKWTALAIKQTGKVVWSDVYSLSEGLVEKTQVISLTRVINDYNHINNPIGLIRIRLDALALKKLIQIPSLEEGAVFLTTANDDLLIQGNTDKQLQESKLQTIRETVNQQEDSVINTTSDDNYITVSKKVDKSDWYLVAMVNKDHLEASLGNVKSMIKYMIITLTLLGIALIIRYYYLDIRRITALMKTTEKIERKDFSVRVNVGARDEIGMLGLRINSMTETLQKLIDQEFKFKIKQKESELKVLQNQIDPHFLYNTLDMIRWKARLEKANETSYLIELISKIFRNNLDSNRVWVKLHEEISFLQNYLYLQQKRMGEKLHYSIRIEPNVNTVYMMKQILQPLVENSIKHGFEFIQKDPRIEIHCYREGDDLITDVIDNGEGMEKAIFENSIKQNEGHALKNIQDRITLTFGIGYGLVLMESIKEGTGIRVRIPLLENVSDIPTLYGELGE
ncbi:cache domain-containing sensor histidine kinase [Aquibacillus kalidii]|uniref:cache domain-containing sensor histidine kinase n=1 Tax=Aquibacillus kalidii TaxID=2762597 RepID=UPI001645573A|nr:sensor histidine kinase [Aquibacillus kalidii]